MQGNSPVECEILNVIQGAGIWPDCNDKTQLLQAINLLIAGGDYPVIVGSEVGSVSAFAMPTAPTGWLVCDGSAVSRTEYADLFAAIGTIWGDGDGASTFNLPDLRGEFVRGFDDGRGVDAGRVFASAQADELKTHTHEVMYSEFSLGVNGGSSGTTGIGRPAASGSTGGLETRPRNVAMTYAIKAFYPLSGGSE
jgi:microcystin-dependent protein